jgi:hypothetical protein
MYSSFLKGPVAQKLIAKMADVSPGQTCHEFKFLLEFALGSGSKSLEEAFVALQRSANSSTHRLNDANAILRSTSSTILTDLLSFRKKHHYLHANMLAQYWFLDAGWAVLKCQSLRFRNAPSVILN